MATTTNIPQVSLPVGSRQFGPHTAKDAESLVILTIDRTVPGGLNSLAADSVISMEAEMSNDGGATWHAVDTDQLGSQTYWTAVGGPVEWTDKQGVKHVYAASSGQWPLWPGTGRRLRATVTVSGPSPVTVSGSIVTQLWPLPMMLPGRRRQVHLVPVLLACHGLTLQLRLLPRL